MMVRATRGRGTVRRLTLKKSVWSGQKRLSPPRGLVGSEQNPREFERNKTSAAGKRFSRGKWLFKQRDFPKLFRFY